MKLLGRPKKILDSIKFTIGITCGSNKHYRSLEHIIEELFMVPLDEVADFKRREGAYPVT